MNEEPPSSEIEPQRLGITKKVQERLRKIYQKIQRCIVVMSTQIKTENFAWVLIEKI